MKNFIFGLTLLVALPSFTVTARDITLEMLGIRVTKDNSKELAFTYSSGLSFILSKKKFETEKEAMDFCDKRNMKLDTDFRVLLLAMTGASSANSTIHELISIDIPNVSTTGIVSWMGDGAGTVGFMYDGRGMSMDKVSIDQINAALQELEDDFDKDPEDDEVARFKLPAVCVKS